RPRPATPRPACRRPPPARTRRARPRPHRATGAATGARPDAGLVAAARPGGDPAGRPGRLADAAGRLAGRRRAAHLRPGEPHPGSLVAAPRAGADGRARPGVRRRGAARSGLAAPRPPGPAGAHRPGGDRHRRARTAPHAGLVGRPAAGGGAAASRDLYSYAAQAQITHAGLDPYSVGPQASLGPFTDEVGYLWQDTPAPYGPLFLTLGRLVAMLTRDHVVLTVLAMRLVAVGGLLVTVRYLPRLATACGADPRLAVWLVLLNPLALIHFIGGGDHHSAMLALIVAGGTMAGGGRPGAPDAQRRLAAGVVLCTLAMLVKAPALLAIGFLVPVWADRLTGRRRWPRAMLRIGVVAAVTFALATLAFGLGIGWIRQLNTPGAVVNPLSVPTGLGLLTAVIARIGPYIDSANPV